MSMACPSVETTARSAAKMGCSGSTARVTPAEAAYEASEPMTVGDPRAGTREVVGPARQAARDEDEHRSGAVRARLGERGGLVDSSPVVGQRGILLQPRLGREEASTAETRHPEAGCLHELDSTVQSHVGDRFPPQADALVALADRLVQCLLERCVLDRCLVERQSWMRCHPFTPFSASSPYQRFAASCGSSSAPAVFASRTISERCGMLRAECSPPTIAGDL